MRVVISDLRPEFSKDVEVEVVGDPATPVLETDLNRAMELLEEARKSDPPEAEVQVGTDGEEDGPSPVTVTLTVGDLEDAIFAIDPERQRPPKEQIRPNDGAGTLIGKLIYSTVTTFYVGEKIMIQMPTWFFPAGAGPYSEAAKFTTHGEPSPTATFRFAEPIFIDKQQNFRVEIEIPDADVQKEVQKIYGPLFIWVVLDGYMTRDVQ